MLKWETSVAYGRNYACECISQLWVQEPSLILHRIMQGTKDSATLLLWKCRARVPNEAMETFASKPSGARLDFAAISSPCGAKCGGWNFAWIWGRSWYSVQSTWELALCLAICTPRCRVPRIARCVDEALCVEKVARSVQRFQLSANRCVRINEVWRRPKVARLVL
jgi:hypothetical protein